MVRRILLSVAAAAALSFGGMTGVASAGGDKPAAVPEGVKVVTTEQLKSMIGQKNVYVYDSRSKAAYQEGHVDGALNLPLDEFDASKLPADKSAQLVFYCGGPSCSLAPSSAGKARKAGYTNVAVYHEGISGWKKASAS